MEKLEARGLNMTDEVQKITMITRDYMGPYQEEQAKNRQLTEEVEALKAQISALGGKDRPRPPRPQMN
jgi:cell division protein FtsB